MAIYFENDFNLENSLNSPQGLFDNENESFDSNYSYFRNINEDKIKCGLSTDASTNKNKIKENKKEIMDHIGDDDFKDPYYNYPIKKDTNEIKQKNLLGRKKKGDSGSYGRHNRYSDDNLRRKCKHLVLDSWLKFINDKIKEKYNGKINRGLFVKQLLIINHKQISNASVQFNKDFLNTTLGEIYSEKISTRYTTYHPCHNSSLIKVLTNDQDEDKRNYFKKLFNLTFIDCLKHFRGTQKIEELEGLKEFNNIKQRYEDDVDYLNSLEYYIMNYEEITNSKRSRKENKNKKEINEP